MAQYIDVSLKLLFQWSRGLVARALFGGPVAEWLNVELPEIRNLRADLLARGVDGSYRHLELEARNTVTLGRRVAEYHLGFLGRLGVPVEMVVLYVGKEPLRMKGEFRTPWMRFRYRLLDIREFDGEPLLASDDLGDNMLALLTRLDQERVLARVEEQLQRLPGGKRAEAARLFVVISGLRDLEETVSRRLDMIDIMENKVLGPAILKGEHQGQIKMLTVLLKDRFGKLPEWVPAKLENASERQLIAWNRRAATARTLDAVFKR
jgi:hypothetical protein